MVVRIVDIGGIVDCLNFHFMNANVKMSCPKGQMLYFICRTQTLEWLNPQKRNYVQFLYTDYVCLFDGV